MVSYTKKGSIDSTRAGHGWIKTQEEVRGDSTGSPGVANRPSKMLSDNLDLLFDSLAAGWTVIKDDTGSLGNGHLVVARGSTSTVELPSGSENDRIRVVNARTSGSVGVSGTGLSGTSLEAGEDRIFTKGRTEWSGAKTGSEVATPDESDNGSAIANTAFVHRALQTEARARDARINGLVDGAPPNRNTLNKLAAALSNLEAAMNRKLVVQMHLPANTDVASGSALVLTHSSRGGNIEGSAVSNSGVTLPAGTYLFQAHRDNDPQPDTGSSVTNRQVDKFNTATVSVGTQEADRDFIDQPTGSTTYSWRSVNRSSGNARYHSHGVLLSYIVTKLA